jgi:RNA polymerase sigma factor (sigma-70 family)
MAGGGMAETDQALLLQLFISNYNALKWRLARRLGSPDAADEALQEAFLRIRRVSRIGTIRQPQSYLFRVALNIAADLRRTEKRRLARSEIEQFLRIEEDELDPERIAAGRSSVRALVQALDALPPRPRAILLAARIDGLTHEKIAGNFGISTRMVERELKLALDHCRARLEIKSTKKFSVADLVPSNEQKRL